MMTQHDLVLQENRVIQEGYKQTEFGVIPESWEINTLEHFTDEKRPICYGIVQTGPKINSGVPCLRVVDILDKKINTENLIYTTQEISSSYKRTILKKGDLVFPLRGKIGTVGLINEELVGANLTRGVALIALKKSNPIFLKQLFGSHKILTQLHGSMNGSALQEITIDTLKKFKVVMPDIVEQQKIATALSDTDALISELEKLIEKKQAIKNATMQQLLTGKTRLPEFALREDGTPKGYKDSDLGQIPEDWEVVQFDKHIEKIIGGGTPSRSIASYWGQDIPWVTVKDFATFDPNSAQEYITNQGLKSSASNLIPAGILITSTRMALGKALIYQVDVAINQDLKAIFTKTSLDATYLKYWFDNNAKKIDDLGSGSTVKGISLPDLKTLSFIEMSLLEQLAIKNILVSIDKDLSLLKQRYEKTKSIKQGMMQELLTGKTRLV